MKGLPLGSFTVDFVGDEPEDSDCLAYKSGKFLNISNLKVFLFSIQRSYTSFTLRDFGRVRESSCIKKGASRYSLFSSL